ncbi:MAG: hypothetical protein J5656_05835 [Clostridia bacterium]|nr:hypothetical protein [Clostridia bacterium]
MADKINYEVVDKRFMAIFACGPIGYMYEIKFHMLDDDTYIYAFGDDVVPELTLAKSSIYDEIISSTDEGREYIRPEEIETVENISKAKKSKYYPLFKILKRYKEEILKQ